MLRRAVLLLVVVAVAGCGFLESDSRTTTTTTTTQPEDPAVATTTATSTMVPDDSPCLAGDRPFADGGLISAFGGANGDANQISGFRWENHPGCERVVIDLLTADGAPAGSLDPARVEYDSRTGVIRVGLPPSIARSAVADSRFDGDIVTRVYTVATATDLAIDIHVAAGRAYAVRAYEVDSPSRIVVDVREDPEAVPVIGAIFGTGVVVLTPAVGPVTPPLRLTGYVRHSFNGVTAELTVDGEVVASETSDPLGGQQAWREFTIVFRDVPNAEVLLVVTPGGQDDQAVEVPIDATRTAGI